MSALGNRRLEGPADLVHVFVDLSNIYIGAKAAARDRGESSTHVRLSAERLVALLARGRTVASATVIANQEVPEPALRRFRLAGFDVEVRESGIRTRTEQANDELLLVRTYEAMTDRRNAGLIDHDRDGRREWVGQEPRVRRGARTSQGLRPAAGGKLLVDEPQSPSSCRRRCCRDPRRHLLRHHIHRRRPHVTADHRLSAGPSASLEGGVKCRREVARSRMPCMRPRHPGPGVAFCRLTQLSLHPAMPSAVRGASLEGLPAPPSFTAKEARTSSERTEPPARDLPVERQPPQTAICLDPRGARGLAIARQAPLDHAGLETPRPAWLGRGTRLVGRAGRPSSVVLRQQPLPQADGGGRDLDHSSAAMNSIADSRVSTRGGVWMR